VLILQQTRSLIPVQRQIGHYVFLPKTTLGALGALRLPVSQSVTFLHSSTGNSRRSTIRSWSSGP